MLDLLSPPESAVIPLKKVLWHFIVSSDDTHVWLSLAV